MPYEEWKAKHQSEASAEQKAAFSGAARTRTADVFQVSTALTELGTTARALLDAGRRASHGFLPAAGALRTPDMSTNSIEAGQLKAFIERIERLEEEKKTIADDIKDVYSEAKGTGYDIKIMRKIVSLRKQDRDKRREEEEILDLYLSALGMS